MPMLNGVKVACSPCIRGHRSSKCQHQKDRFMVPVRKPGRPLNDCPHLKPAMCSCSNSNSNPTTPLFAAIPKGSQACGGGNDSIKAEPRPLASAITSKSALSVLNFAQRIQKEASQHERRKSYDLQNIAKLEASGGLEQIANIRSHKAIAPAPPSSSQSPDTNGIAPSPDKEPLSTEGVGTCCSSMKQKVHARGTSLPSGPQEQHGLGASDTRAQTPALSQTTYGLRPTSQPAQGFAQQSSMFLAASPANFMTSMGNASHVTSVTDFGSHASRYAQNDYPLTLAQPRMTYGMYNNYLEPADSISIMSHATNHAGTNGVFVQADLMGQRQSLYDFHGAMGTSSGYSPYFDSPSMSPMVAAKPNMTGGGEAMFSNGNIASPFYTPESLPTSDFNFRAGHCDLNGNLMGANDNAFGFYGADIGTYDNPLTQQSYLAMVREDEGSFSNNADVQAVSACDCGPDCSCPGCATHPFNPTMLDEMQNIYEEELQSPIATSPINNNADLSSILGRVTSSTDDSNLVDGSPNGQDVTLDPNDFLFVQYDLAYCKQCKEEPAKIAGGCSCGDSCACEACEIHRHVTTGAQLDPVLEENAIAWGALPKVQDHPIATQLDRQIDKGSESTIVENDGKDSLAHISNVNGRVTVAKIEAESLNMPVRRSCCS